MERDALLLAVTGARLIFAIKIKSAPRIWPSKIVFRIVTDAKRLQIYSQLGGQSLKMLRFHFLWAEEGEDHS